MFIKGRLICDAAGEHRHINLVELRKQHEADGKSGEVAESQGPALILPCVLCWPWDWGQIWTPSTSLGCVELNHHGIGAALLTGEGSPVKGVRIHVPLLVHSWSGADQRLHLLQTLTLFSGAPAAPPTPLL